MSSVVVQVGQCGNQIGQAFWSIAQNTDELKCVKLIFLAKYCVAWVSDGGLQVR